MSYDNIYACVTRYQLLCSILHRRANPDGSAIVFVYNLTFTDEELGRVFASLRATEVFDVVRAYNEKGLWDKIAKATVGTSAKAKAGALVQEHHMPGISSMLITHFEKTIGDVAGPKSNWYVAADHYSFGMALVLKGLQYAQLEDHSGGFENPRLQLETFERLNLFQYKVYDFMSEARQASIRAHVVDTLTNDHIAETHDVEQIHVRKTLDSMAPTALGELLTVFDYIPVVDAADERDTALLITQPFARWKFLDWMSQKELYYTLVDYFAPDARVIVKPHPQDDLTPYEFWFPQARIAPSKVPMELVLTSVKPSLALTVGSTAIFPLRGSDTDTVFLGQGFERTYKQLHRLWAMATILGWLGADPDDVSFLEDFPQDALRAFLDRIPPRADTLNGPSVLACWGSSPSESDLESHDVVMSLSPITWSTDNVVEHRAVVRRRKDGDVYLAQSLIYFYSQDPHQFDDVKGLKLERSLTNLREDETIIFPADDDTVFLQAQVASLEARVSDLTSRLREIESESA